MALLDPINVVNVELLCKGDCWWGPARSATTWLQIPRSWELRLSLHVRFFTGRRAPGTTANLNSASSIPLSWRFLRQKQVLGRPPGLGSGGLVSRSAPDLLHSSRSLDPWLVCARDVDEIVTVCATIL